MPEAGKKRLDQILLERGFAESRERAQRMIRAGQVWRATDVLDKPGVRLPLDVDLDVRSLRERFVSRGGEKLQAAFDAWPAALTPCPEVCADIGASTGGFTDCLLQQGARHVYAIDVGTAQLADRLLEDQRVTSMEKTNARYLTAESLPEPIDLVVSDVSFISLRLILGPANRLLRRPDGQAVVLVKPQFEAGRKHVGKGGVVRDPAVHRDVLRGIALDFVPTVGFAARGVVASPLRGPKGNHEYLLWLGISESEAKEPGMSVADIDRVIEGVFNEI